MIKIKRITIRNFKNLKNVTIYPRKFNVLVGPNASGKTNFVQFFKLLRNIFSKCEFPFSEFGGYRKVVYRGDESLNLEFEIEYKIESFNCSYKIVFRSAEFGLKILKEIFEIKELNFKLERYENSVTSRKKTWKTIDNEPLFGISGFSYRYRENGADVEVHVHVITEEGKYNEINLGNFPVVKFHRRWFTGEAFKYEKFVSGAFPECLFFIKELFTRATIILYALSPLYIKQQCYPIVPRREFNLKEDGSSLFNVLYTLYLYNNHTLPEKIKYLLAKFFNVIGYRFEPDPEGIRIHLILTKQDHDISIREEADGLIKSLAVLTALELKPMIILIDEIENSLHPELLETIVKELKNANSYVFITTHNPLVLDFADPEEILIFKLKDEHVEIKKATDYKSKDELLKEVEELGISLGEKVFYGLI